MYMDVFPYSPWPILELVYALRPDNVAHASRETQADVQCYDIRMYSIEERDDRLGLPLFWGGKGGVGRIGPSKLRGRRKEGGGGRREEEEGGAGGSRRRKEEEEGGRRKKEEQEGAGGSRREEEGGAGGRSRKEHE